MRNFKILLAYDGTEFSGWQVQPGSATIQGTLASAIGRIEHGVIDFLGFGRKSALRAGGFQGAGRTDAGVHALAQVATFVMASTIPAENLVKALNDILPASIRVLEASEVPKEFHARKSARAKTYRYRMYRGPICPPFLARYAWHYPYPLDESAMQQAAGLVVGEHDFTSFAAADPERGCEEDPASNLRRIFESNWERAQDELTYTVRGNGFLHHMVRNLVGTFVLVGKGTLKPNDITQILHARNRSQAGATAPASGLFLVQVHY
jgi:tRNA pseudouridine38-40 synthase